MDAEFVSSVVTVGDHVEIRLTFGDLIAGTLTELTQTRLTVRQDDGVDVALALGVIAWVRRTSTAPTVQPAPAVQPSTLLPSAPLGGPPTVPAPLPLASPMPVVVESVAAPIAEPESEPEPERIIVEEYDDEDEDEDLLEALGQMSVVPLRVKLLGSEACRKDLESICSSLANAERIHELSVRHNRVPRLYQRAKQLQIRDPDSPDMFYLCGVLGILNEDYAGARPYLATGADMDGDPECWRLLAIASARNDDRDAAVFALVNYFKVRMPNSEDPLWPLLLRILDRHGIDRGVLHELVGPAERSRQATALVSAALAGAVPPPAPLARPAGALRRPFAPGRSIGLTQMPPPQAAKGAAAATRRGENPYQRAKRLENREKNFTGAKEAYREAIRQQVRVDSAVKDLAWLTRRIDGPMAALEVITSEYAGLVNAGDALDNILIDFHVGAGNYDEALVILRRQKSRSDITDSKRNHLRQQIAYVKFSAGLDCVDDWMAVLKANRSPAARRGLALALIQRDDPNDLDRAEKVIATDEDDKADDIRRRIDQIRTGESTGVDPRWASQILGELEQLAITPLVDFVMERYSSSAANLREQRERENKQLTSDDAHRLAANAQRLRGRARESSADNYISAAVIAWEVRRDDFQELLCSGLTAVADVVLERQAPEAARGLYLEALRASEGLDDPDRSQDARLALLRFMRSLDGRRTLMPGQGRADPSIRKIIAEQYAEHGDRVFDLVTQLVSQVDVASDQVLEAVCTSSELIDAALRYLKERATPDTDLSSGEAITKAWRRLGEQVAQEHPNAMAQLQFLHDVSLAEDLLANTAERLESLPDDMLNPTMVRRLADGLQRLRDYLYENSFEDREASLRRTGELMRLIQQDIQQAPTRLSVEVVWPVCKKVERIVDEAQLQLLARHPPEPMVSLGLPTSSVDKTGVITVQIKVGNQVGAAPLESPMLICRDDPEFFHAVESIIALPSAVRGGDHHIQVVRLKATAHAIAAGAFSLAISLEYKARAAEETEISSVTLPIRVLSGTEFQPIVPNPFREGASGKAVESTEMFVGRDEVLRRILEHFDSAQSPGSGVAIFGQKRAGKSSIRIHLRGKLKEKHDFIVVDMDNVGVFSPAKGEQDSRRLIAEILWSIITLAERAVRGRFSDRMPAELLSAGWTKAAFVEEYQPVSVFIDLIQDYLARWPEDARPQLIVLIDEFQYFDEWIRTGQLSPSFMQALKAIIERRLFHLVIVGQDAIERLIADNANVFGVFATERVTYLAPEDARLLIDRPIRSGDQSRYRELAIDRIIELTGGSAFYIQKFCYALVEYMNEQQTPLVTEADVELVRDRFLQSIRTNDFDNLETAGYTDPDQPDATTYRKALQAVAIAAKDGRATYDRIAEAYQGSVELRPLIDDLVLRDVIREESGSYWIVVRLYQDWVLSRTTQVGSHTR